MEENKVKMIYVLLLNLWRLMLNVLCENHESDKNDNFGKIIKKCNFYSIFYEKDNLSFHVIGVNMGLYPCS